MFEGQFDGLEFLVGTGGEIGNGAVFDFALLAEGLAQEDPAIGVAIDRGLRAVEIHSEHIILIIIRYVKANINIISGYNIGAEYGQYIGYHSLRDFG